MSKSDDKSFPWGLLIILLVGYFIFGDGCGGKNSIGKSLSNTKEKCIFCYGKGEKDCFSCSGKGIKDCTLCYGQGKQNCNACSGTGKEWRNDYGHDYNNGGKYHRYYAQFPCNKCSQSGKIECSNVSCDYGKVKCTYCYGKGKEKCTYCYGKGFK